MHISRETLDDVLLELYPALLSSADHVAASRGGNTEILGVQVEIKHPRARLSRSETRGKPFSSLGELLWYLTRDNQLDFIERYVPRYKTESEDGVSVYGGYGRRLFQHHGQDQVQNVIDLLKARPTSRRAAIQIFDAEDIGSGSSHAEIPCTTMLQFLVRDAHLHMVTTMRSNDAYLGLPHDVFCFTMLQEMLARTLNYELGIYRHFVASMHLYSQNRTGAQQFVDEGFQSRIEMPEMPLGDPWPAISEVLTAEKNIRMGAKIMTDVPGLDPYWCDLIRMLQIFEATGDDQRIAELREEMSYPRYRTYINNRMGMKPRA